MQTRFRLSMLIVIATVMMVSSCSKKTNKEGRYVPNTASAIFLVNGESLSSKLPWDEIKQNSMFQEMQKEFGMDSTTMQLFQNPENTGIDTKKTILIFMQSDSTGGYIAIEGSLKDAAKFKATNTSMLKNAEATEKDGIHFLTSNNNKMATSWDKDKFVVVMDAPGMDGNFRSFNVKRDVVTTAMKIYSLEEKNSYAENEKFSALVNTKADVLFFINNGAFSSKKGLAELKMLNLDKFSKDAFTTAAINFDNGKINAEIKSYTSKEIGDIYKKYSGSKLNTEMIKRVPAKEITGLFAFSYKPEGLKEMIKLLGLDGFINVATADFNLTFEDFVKANKGDVLIAVSDIKRDSNGVPQANALFSTAIGDKKEFAKLLEAGKNLTKDKMGSKFNEYVSYTMNDTYFVMGTDKPTIEQYLSSANNNSFNLIDKASGSSFLLYLNLPAMFKGIAGDQSIKDSLDNLSYQATLKTWENVIGTGGEFKDGAYNMHFELNFMDKSTNSLKQLNKYVNDMAEIEKQRRAKRDRWMEDMEIPTVPAPPPASN